MPGPEKFDADGGAGAASSDTPRNREPRTNEGTDGRGSSSRYGNKAGNSSISSRALQPTFGGHGTRAKPGILYTEKDVASLNVGRSKEMTLAIERFIDTPETGCGSGWNERVVPDLFAYSCNAHDNCYSDVETSKASCDVSFLKDMLNERPYLQKAALTYFLGVDLLGRGSFTRAQRSSIRQRGNAR